MNRIIYTLILITIVAIARISDVSPKQPCSYFGDKGEWLQVISHTRDSSCLERSNFQVATKMMEDVDSECFEIERYSHWACGWIETLVIDPDNKAAVEKGNEIITLISQYPILDEDHYSQLQDDEAYGFWNSLSLHGKVDICSDLGVSIFAARRDSFPEQLIEWF